MLKEKGFLYVFYSFHFRYPAKSLRNIVIFFFVIFSCVFFLLISLEDSDIYFLTSYSAIVSPIISFLLVLFGVLITQIPVYFYRQILILRAKSKVKKSGTVWIGITGSYGKTSVKEFIFELLSTTFKTAKTPANYNSDVGIAISILKNLKQNTEFFVTEFGAYRKGEIKKASSYIPLTYVVVTGIGNQHLDLYGSRENLIEEETYLAYTLDQSGRLYLKENLPHRAISSNEIKAEKIYYGFENNSTIKAVLLPQANLYQRAKITYKHHSFIITTKLLGSHTIENLLPAIAITIDLGITPEKIIKKIHDIEPVPGKLSLHTGKNKATVINDAVNSNTEGFIAAIHTLNSFKHKSKIIISQGIIELGVEKKDTYRRIMAEILKTDIQFLTTDKLFKEITEKKYKDRVETFNDVWDLHRKSLSKIDQNTAILLEGKFSKPFIDSLL
jgi:UDP-N-acetylmuramoyl-tripeptide--D-alanyl-D-alanine ligase